MNTINSRTTMVFILILICSLAAIIVGYKMQKTLVLISYLNAIVAMSVIVYWIFNNINIKQHYFEFREAFALCLEACILIFALYAVLGFQNNSLKIINYIAFGLHLLAVIGILVFISTFKITKLF